MSKKAYYKCDECGISFPEDKLVLNNKLELNCLECEEEAKKDRRVHNLFLLVCVALACIGFLFIYKLFVK